MTGVFESREPLSAYCVAWDAAIRLLASHQDNKTPFFPLFSFSKEDPTPCLARETKPLIMTASIIKFYTRRKIHHFARCPAIRVFTLSFYIIPRRKSEWSDLKKSM